jgi:hypothetical protein
VLGGQSLAPDDIGRVQGKPSRNRWSTLYRALAETEVTAAVSG